MRGRRANSQTETEPAWVRDEEAFFSGPISPNLLLRNEFFRLHSWLALAKENSALVYLIETVFCNISHHFRSLQGQKWDQLGQTTRVLLMPFFQQHFAAFF